MPAALLRTFIVRQYADGSSTVEDASTGQRIAVKALDELGRRIAMWMTAAAPADHGVEHPVDPEDIDLRSAPHSDGLARHDPRLQA